MSKIKPRGKVPKTASVDEIIEIINNITATHSGLTIQYLNVGFLFK